MSRKIIIDTDPGQDDAVAILLALASPEDFDVLGIVAVAGNVGLDLCALNARKIVELSGRIDVPVFAGCDKPLRRKLVTAEYVHGKTGLDGPVLPEPKLQINDQHGVDFIIETLRREPPKSVTLCALGPLTNIATAITRAPDIVDRVAELAMMGGAYFEVGNTTPAAEFNIYVDPHAADIVMRSGIKLTIAPLDVTHQVLASGPRIAAIRKLGTRTAAAVADMLEFFERFDEDKYGWDGGPLHDPCVPAWLIRPDLFSGRFINVTIETSSELTMGMTVADYWGVMDKEKFPPNATFLRNVDADGFFALLTERLARLP